MAAQGKNINYYLMDGTADGRIKCTMANWTGVAYRIPRVDLEKCEDRQDLKQSGVYFLFGMPDETSKPVIYVGQAGVRQNEEAILCRLKEHKKDQNKDYWTEAIAFTTSNNSFGSTEISYLENRFYAIAKAANRYIVKNFNEPTRGNVTEEKECELEKFIEYARIVVGVLGHKVFEPFVLNEPNTADDRNKESSSSANPVYYIKNKRGADARAVETADGVIVLAGSVIMKEVQPTCPNGAKNAREQYKDDIDENMKILKDIPFSSPSAAGAFVLGNSVNGNKVWTTEQGIPFGEFEGK